MRFWQWGQADAEWADWYGTRHEFRTPFGPWGDTSELAETDGVNNQDDLQIGGYGSNDIHNEFLIWIDIAQIKAKLGQVPILLLGAMNVQNLELGTSGAFPVNLHRMIRTWDKGDTSNWRYDKTADLDWYLDKHHIVRGQDMEATPSYSFTVDHVYQTAERVDWPLTTIVARALRDNAPLKFNVVVTMVGSDLSIDWNPPIIKTARPYMFFAFVYPIEFYRDDGSGNLDLSSPVTDIPGDEYYLGTAEPGQTGVAVKCHIRNYSDSIQQVEILDDHPEYTTPITRIGSSTLDYIGLADNAVSQKYTAVFYSSTQFEVKAVAYRDNAISLHPIINADATWRGAVGSDFTAPDGGLIIPSAAWQPGTALNDEYEVGVRGQTTDSAWPADSNDQIEITKDNAGVADAGAWRPCLGRRDVTRAQVTINATTMLIPTRRVIPANWPVDTKAFIMDAANINEGEISSIQEADIGTLVFSGSGPDDATFSGNYNGVWTDDLRVEIDATGTPDTFRVSYDGGSSFPTTGVPITGSAQLLKDGLYVTFVATTGHTLNDYWEAPIAAWAIELKGLTANSNVYGSGARIATTLPIRDVASSTFSTVDAASGVSEGTPARIWVASTAGMSPGQNVFIQNPSSPGTAEIREIDSVQSGSYIDVTVALDEDYPIGSFVAVIGTGQAVFWARPAAEVTTNEELKRLRFIARML